MNYGFIKAAACTPEIVVADCIHNAQAILDLMKKSAAEGVRLAVFPELCLTGYTCGDLFTQQTLLESVKQNLLKLAEESRSLQMISVIGAPIAHYGKLYNCGVVLYSGKILGIVPKTEIPNYAEFYEARNFCAAPEMNGTVRIGEDEIPFGKKLLFCCNEMPEFIFGIEICEDLWVCRPPSTGHAIAGATVILNLSASNEIVGKADFRRQLVESQSARLVCGYLYADAGEGESTTDLVFSGHNLIAQNGRILAEAQPFSSGYCVTELDLEELMSERQRLTTFPRQDATGYQMIPFNMEKTPVQLTRNISKNPFVPADSADLRDRCEKILAIQSAGLRKRINHTHVKTVVIGVSGGLDSTLALLVSVRAMKESGHLPSDVIAVTMPGFGTTRRTKKNAIKLCESLGVTLRKIDITRSVRSHFRDLGQDENDHNVLFENAQARERTQILMDICHQTDGFVVGTGDLSELALGWATYNGDHMSMYGVNASVPKTLVRYLVRYYADYLADKQVSEILSDILNTPVSPELLPAAEGKISQLTENIIGPYELHDFFLYYFIRHGFSPEKVAWLANYAFKDTYSADEIQKWLKVFIKRFFNNQFKRSCLPDGPKVGSVSLSPRGDWRMPSDASFKIWIDSLDR
ncbi:MAG TPA: NAD(+) synthase [Flexilinea sp.]|nr:NAD(+) synthase [Flexilinea sp.]